jgi:transcriptional regulator with XRE-family HTH domain
MAVQEEAMLYIDQLPEGTQLRLARIAAGLTLFDVGQRADVSPPRLSEFERGRPSLSPEALARVRVVLAGEAHDQTREDTGDVE